jgi:hypothetical protein
MPNLITLNEYKDYVGIASSEQDQKLISVIAYVSDLIKTYCSRNFVDSYAGGGYTTITEYSNGGSTYYYTKEFPIREVEGVSYSTDLGTTYTAMTLGTDYAVDIERDRIFIARGEYIQGVNALKVQYKGGFKEAPNALKVATLDLVKYYMKQEDTPRKTAGNVTMEYITSSDLPAHIKRVLDLFRVV